MPKLQSLLPVAFSGAPGAYSEQAAQRFFGPGSPTLTCGSVGDAVAAVQQGRASHAMVPIENSITGCFEGLAEALCSTAVRVRGEVILPIRHCLLAAAGAALSEISVVTSHPSALAQCRDWLASFGVAARPAADTAQAACELARTRDQALGVLGSRVLAELYGLDVLAEGLSDRADNRTRFYALSAPEAEAGTALKAAAPAAEGTRSALLIGPVGAPRTLRTLRMQLETQGARRVRVPLLGSADGRHFLIEFDHKPGAAAALVEQACSGLPYRLLGSWAPPALERPGFG